MKTTKPHKTHSMKNIIIASLILFTLISKAQLQSETIYYADKNATRETWKGAYTRLLTKINDSVINEVFKKTKNGQLIWTKSYLNSQPFGIWKWYDKKGNVAKSIEYKDIIKYGAFIPAQAFTLEELGIDPETDANKLQITEHIRKNFKYPNLALKNGIQGKVSVQFTIDSAGQIDNLRILEGVHFLLDSESIRIMKALKKLSPYQKNGEPIMVYYTMPITFRLM
jgi:protein TonB